MSSSRPDAPIVAEPPPSRILATSAARFSGVLPSAIMASTASVRNCASSFAESPSEPVGRTISPWLIGMPPNIWSRYSPAPIFTRSVSVSPSWPASRRLAAYVPSSRTASP